VAFSFSLPSLLATGPVESIRFRSLCTGKRRFVRVRSAVRAVQGVIDCVGLALWTVLDRNRRRVEAGATYVSARASAGYCRSRNVVVGACQAISDRVGRSVSRVLQVFAVVRMYFTLFGLLGVSRVSRKAAVWSPVETSLPEPEKPVALPVVESSLLIYQDEPAALPGPVAMACANRVTEPVAKVKARKTKDNDRGVLVERAKALIADGASQRAAAKEVGLSESTLRTRLRK
jgi:hypothetical protein